MLELEQDTTTAAPDPAPAPAPAAPLAVRPAEAAPVLALPVESRWALEPRSMNGAVWLAKSLHESRLFSGYGNSGYGSPEQILTVILAGREMGLGAVTALRGIYVVKGKIAMGASLMVGLCLASGRCDYFDLAETDAKHALYITRRKGSTREVPMTFTLEQARQMRLLEPSKSGEPTQWDKDPENMLRHRASSRLARAVYPDICANVYTPEELEES